MCCMDNQLKLYVSLKGLPNMYSQLVVGQALLASETGSYQTNKYQSGRHDRDS